jgi:hypothetical protein
MGFTAVRRFGLLLTAFGAALVLASAASAAIVPSKGSFASTCPSTSSGACGTFAGRQAPFGPFTGVITGAPTPGTDGCPSAANLCETATETYPNGDQTDTFGITYVTGFDASTGLFEFVQQTSIVGGTGRFANATGTSVAHGETSADNSSYYASYTGTVTTP